MEANQDLTLTCPIPIQNYPHVLLAHGGGGRLMHQLIDQMFRPAFGTATEIPHDATTLTLPGQKIAMTTDSFVVNPLFFPGGDIGSMAIYGTVNDLAMAGARPLYLGVGFILEEGLPMTTLWRIIQAMQMAAKRAGVKIVTGDTKVVDRGKGDGIFINTSGVGIIEHPITISPTSVQSGDAVLVSGDLGRHGIAIMAVREGLEFETTIESDSAPVADVVLELLNAGVDIHCLRDLTRGGLASALNEIATATDLKIAIDENKIPVREDVGGACEILGFDPLYVANEGRFVAFIPEKDREKSLAILQQKESSACAIGTVGDRTGARVTMRSKIGATRIIDLLSGEQLPRIC
ncbi:MAG: hydrogenase expression/formation protein HypE [Limnospira sp.]